MPAITASANVSAPAIAGPATLVMRMVIAVALR